MSYTNVRWQTLEAGILRKKEVKDEELFVFGYSCKIFNDYDKALYIDQGKHLIPWMGDETLKIDRYDCRGALNDLSPYIPSSEGYDPWLGFTAEERKIEELCDKERYKSLNASDTDDVLYQEEELKRLHQALNSEKSYAEVAYTYDTNAKPEEAKSETEKAADDDEPFVPPYHMDIPVGINIPTTKKQHEIIEKTSVFINQQGPQMEVLIKMKQADNPLFKFLEFDDPLYPYYRYLLTAVKNKRYKMSSAEKRDKQEESKQENIVQPVLPIISTADLAPAVPTISYKQSADCSYLALVNRIKETTAVNPLLDEIKKYSTPTSSNDRSSNSRASSVSSSDMSQSPVSSQEDVVDQGPYTSPVPSPTEQVPLSALSKSARRRRIRKEKQKAAAESYKIYYIDETPPQPQSHENPENTSELISSCQSHAPEQEKENVPVPVLKQPVIQIPSPDIQLIIDKMASYVAKNGRDFEDIVRKKGDPRFEFLSPDHMYNPYYNQKIDLYLQLETVEQKGPTVDSSISAPSENNAPSAPIIGPLLPDGSAVLQTPATGSKKKLSKSKPMPISFSIKKSKEQDCLGLKCTLPKEQCASSESEEELENNAQKMETSFIESGSSQQPASQLAAESAECDATRQQTESQSTQQEHSKKHVMSPESWAKERVKAKLMMTAKEKLAAKEKDKQLQAERRRKAAEFINLLQKENLVNSSYLGVSLASNEVAKLHQHARRGGKEELSDLSDNSRSSKIRHKEHRDSRYDSGKSKKRKKHISDSDDDDDDEERRRRKHHHSHSHSRSRHSRHKREKRSHKKKKRKHHKSKDEDRKHRKHHKSRKSKYSSTSSSSSESSKTDFSSDNSDSGSSSS